MKSKDIRVRSYQFSITVVRFVGDLPKQKVYFVIGDQLLRSATSIGANIVEAKCSGSKKEFARYFEIALKSANETKYWLSLLRDSSLVSGEKINPILDEATQLSNMLGSSLLTLKGKKKF